MLIAPVTLLSTATARRQCCVVDNEFCEFFDEYSGDEFIPSSTSSTTSTDDDNRADEGENDSVYDDTWFRILIGIVILVFLLAFFALWIWASLRVVKKRRERQAPAAVPTTELIKF